LLKQMILSQRILFHEKFGNGSLVVLLKSPL